MKTQAKNKYYKRSHISEVKFRQIIKCFLLDLNVYETSTLTNISHVSCKKIFQKLRIYIFLNLLESEVSDGEFEFDESYFGAKRVRGKRVRGAAGKTLVFRLLKRDGNVYVQIVKNCSKAELIPTKDEFVRGKSHVNGIESFWSFTKRRLY